MLTGANASLCSSSLPAATIGSLIEVIQRLIEEATCGTGRHFARPSRVDARQEIRLRRDVTANDGQVEASLYDRVLDVSDVRTSDRCTRAENIQRVQTRPANMRRDDGALNRRL